MRSLTFIRHAVPALMMVSTLAGCAPKTEAPNAEPRFRVTASIQEIMNSMVDPSADEIWDSVASISTKEGNEERQPRTDEEWLAVRRRAITLIEATNLLTMDGRTVAHQGGKLEDSHVDGILAPQEIQKTIDADPARFAAFAYALHDAGVDALKAIDAKDAQRLLEAGDHMDQACERCHMSYWYPNDKRPTEKWPESFEKKGI